MSRAVFPAPLVFATQYNGIRLNVTSVPYGGLHQKSWTVLVAALILISEGGPGTRALELSPGSAKVDTFWTQ